jgi:hypothetical protein
MDISIFIMTKASPCHDQSISLSSPCRLEASNSICVSLPSLESAFRAFLCNTTLSLQACSIVRR